jgi:hypothetical protein
MNNKMFQIIKILLQLPKWNQNKDKNSNNQKYLSNLYQSTYEKRALVSFIVHPFLYPKHYFFHTNRIECKTLCDILNELGYQVDLVDYDYTEFDSQYEYDLILGYGFPIENMIFKYGKRKSKYIIYRNGTNEEYSDLISLERAYEFYIRTNNLILDSVPTSRYSFKGQLYFADKILVLGNLFVQSTYHKFTHSLISPVNLFFYDVGKIDFNKKNFSKVKNNYLWFGSKGAIRKGLDICLEYFAKRTDINLYVAGLSESETTFIEFYSAYFNLDNIFNIGFVKMESDEFQELMMNCAAIIFPTIWEGGGGAVLNVTASAGLIPIVTENLGLDFNNDEILIPKISMEGLDFAIKKFETLSYDDICEKSKRINNFIRNNHTYENYKNSLIRNINSLL